MNIYSCEPVIHTLIINMSAWSALIFHHFHVFQIIFFDVLSMAIHPYISIFHLLKQAPENTQINASLYVSNRVSKYVYIIICYPIFCGVDVCGARVPI